MAARKKARQRKGPSPGDGRRAVLVVGPPRSGTSVVAHMLSKLGVYFGEETDFLDPSIHTHNPIFFELKRLNELNERVLNELGYEYGDFDFFPAPDQPWDLFSRELVADGRNLLQEQLHGRPLIGLKDPRFCFTLPFWRRILADQGYAPSFVWATRTTEATIRSNALVNQQVASYSARVTMLSLDASAMHLKGLEPRVDVDYDDLIGDPQAVANRLAAWLGADAGIDEAASVVKGELRGQVGDRSGHEEAIALEERAERYLTVRAEMERRGVLDLVTKRRKEVLELEKNVRWRDEEARTNAKLANLLDTITPELAWQSSALLQQGDFLRGAQQQAFDLQTRHSVQLDAIHAAQSSLSEKMDSQSNALLQHVDSLRAVQQQAFEVQNRSCMQLDAIDAAHITLGEKLEWQSSALLQQGDFLRGAQLHSSEVQIQQSMKLDEIQAAHLALLQKMESQSHALNEQAEYLRGQAEINRITHVELKEQCARLQTDLEQAKAEARAADEARMASEEMATTVRTEMSELQTRVTSLEVELRTTREMLSSANHELEKKALSELNSLREMESLRHTVKTRNVQLETVLAEMEIVSARLVEAESALSRATRERKLAEKRAAAMLERIESADSELLALKETIASLDRQDENGRSVWARLFGE